MSPFAFHVSRLSSIPASPVSRNGWGEPSGRAAARNFKITSFPMKADGSPDVANIVFEPPTAQWNVPATWKVKGTAALAGPWEDVPAGGNSAHKFFKVVVEVP